MIDALQIHPQPIPPALRTHALTRTFGSMLAVDGLELEVPRGAFFGFLGPNGAGKSTSIKMLTGLLAPTSGTIEILGHTLHQEPEVVKRLIGVVPEDLSLFDRLTGPEFLYFAGRMHGLSRGEVRRRAEELLALMNLLDRPQTLIVEYSHGMKKKLSLAAALIHSPQMLFLDEPFEGVDAVASLTLRSLLQELTARGLTIFLTSHVLEIVERLCTHLAILNRGKIVVQGTLSDLQTASGTGSLEALFIRSVGAPPERASGLDWLSSPGSFPGSSDSGGRL